MAEPGWSELYAWHIVRDGREAVFQQVYAQIRSAILSGTFAPGAKLPSTRALARRLAIARSSVATAYEQLFAEGFLSGRVGSGTYVSSDLPEAVDVGPVRTKRRPLDTPPPTARLTHKCSRAVELVSAKADRPFNTARMLIDARTAEIWRKLTGRAMRSLSDIHTTYSDPRGLIELRRAVCDYVRVARAVRCEPEQILITAGSQQAFDIAIRVLLSPGDTVWVEDPGYPLTYRALAAAGMAPLPLPVDAQGMNVARAIKTSGRTAKAAVVTPSLQYPTGVVLSMPRRLELLGWARDSGAWIIEDDWASEYRYSGRPLASLQGLDEDECVIYLGTLNKTLFPGLRIGYAVVPYALMDRFVATRQIMDRQPPTLQQGVLAEFMAEGHLAAHIRRMRLIYRSQRDALVSELAQKASDHLEVAAPDQGMHIVAHVRHGLSDVAIEAAAQARGIVVQALSRFYLKARPRPALMLGFCGYPSHRLVRAAAELAAVTRTEMRARQDR
jgi:GntR family transcriptional regulator / MocR family aminotransferase